MIENMHNRLNGPIFKIVFPLISLALILGGIGTNLFATGPYAAKINGELISQESFNQQKQKEYHRLNEQMGSKFWDLIDNPTFAEQLHYSILNTLINENLLKQFIKELGIDISDNQITQQIISNPDFQQQNKYNNELYRQFLLSMGISPAEYGRRIKEAMIIEQFNSNIIDTAFTVPAEQEQLARLLFQQRDFRVASFPVTQSIIEKQFVSQQEIEQYYTQHQQQFIEPEQLQVEYITYSPQDAESQAVITDEEINHYYQNHINDFTIQGESHIAHIQISTEDKAKVILEQLKNGTDFVTLAQQYSEDSASASNGGDLGWNRKGFLPTEFDANIEKLKIGDVSEAIRVGENYHIIKLIDRKSDKVLPLSEQKAKIARKISQEYAISQYPERLKEMVNKAFEYNDSLEETAKVANLTIQRTAFFDRSHIPSQLNSDKLATLLFEGDLRQSKQNSEAIDIGDENTSKTLFMRVVESKPEKLKSQSEVTTEIEQLIKKQKAEASLLTQVAEAVNKLEAGQIANEAVFGATNSLTYIEQKDPMFTQTLFSMPKPSDKTTYKITQNQQGDILIIALDKVRDGSQTQLNTISAQLNNLNQQNIHHNLLNSLRERATIEINKEFMDQFNHQQ